MIDAAQSAALRQYFASRQEGDNYGDLSPGEFVFKMTGRVLLDQIHWEAAGNGRYNFFTDCGIRVDWWDSVDQSCFQPIAVMAYKSDVNGKMYYTSHRRDHVTCPGCINA